MEFLIIPISAGIRDNCGVANLAIIAAGGGGRRFTFGLEPISGRAGFLTKSIIGAESAIGILQDGHDYHARGQNKTAGTKVPAADGLAAPSRPRQNRTLKDRTGVALPNLACLTLTNHARQYPSLPEPDLPNFDSHTDLGRALPARAKPSTAGLALHESPTLAWTGRTVPALTGRALPFTSRTGRAEHRQTCMDGTCRS